MKGCWWCQSQLSEHRTVHREGAQRWELLTALEAGRSEIQADAVAAEGLASESHRGHLLSVSLGTEEPRSFRGFLNEHPCCRPEAFILMIYCVPEGPTCVTQFQKTQDWTGHRCDLILQRQGKARENHCVEPLGTMGWRPGVVTCQDLCKLVLEELGLK